MKAALLAQASAALATGLQGRLWASWRTSEKGGGLLHDLFIWEKRLGGFSQGAQASLAFEAKSNVSHQSCGGSQAFVSQM